MDLEGKTALVTGSTSGIGMETAAALAGALIEALCSLSSQITWGIGATTPTTNCRLPPFPCCRCC